MQFFELFFFFKECVAFSILWHLYMADTKTLLKAEPTCHLKFEKLHRFKTVVTIVLEEQDTLREGASLGSTS